MYKITYFFLKKRAYVQYLMCTNGHFFYKTKSFGHCHNDETRKLLNLSYCSVQTS